MWKHQNFQKLHVDSCMEIGLVLFREELQKVEYFRDTCEFISEGVHDYTLSSEISELSTEII